MPRNPEIEPRTLEEKLKEWPRIFNDAQLLKPEKDPIWRDIKKSLNVKMSAKSLFLYLYNDRHSCRSNLQNFFKIKEVERNLIKTEKGVSSENDNSMEYEEISFEITVPANLIINECSENKRKQEGWTDVLHMAIWEEKQLPCCYNFKNSWLTSDKLKFYGFCTDCGSKIRGEGEVIEQENFKFKIETHATFHIKHTKKRKLKGKRRIEIKKKLLCKTAGEYREEELAQMKVSYEPPHLNTSTTLSKARQHALDEEFGFVQYKGLSISNRNFLNVCNVRKLSLSPFYLWYWSDRQLQLWNCLQKEILPLSFDSTGSLVKKYSFYPNSKSKTLFIYVLVIGFKGKIIPLLQAILSIHDVSVIQELLSHWIECGAQTPKEIVTDGSLALQNAISLAFNKMTFKNYNLQCFRILNGESDMLPKCYLRLDVAHLINAVRRWNCFKLSNITVIDFYLRSIGFLIQVETLPEFEHIVMSIVIVANSEIAEIDSVCYKSKTMLLETFKTYKCTLDKFNHLADQSDISTISQNENEERKLVDVSKNDLLLYIDNIFKKALTKCQSTEKISDKGNFYFCSEFTKNFQNLCYTFPTWTNFMQKYFASPNKVGTSSRSEAYFKELKKRIPRPVVAQKYMLIDKQKITALTNFAFSRISKTSDSEFIHITNNNKQQDKLDLDLESLNVSTNKDIDASSKQHSSLSTSIIKDFFPAQSSSPLNSAKMHNSSTLHSFSSIDNEQFAPPQNSTFTDNMERQLINTSANDSLKFRIVPPLRNLIKNGNRIKIKCYNISQSIMQLAFRNTCPFDSTFELFCSGYINNSSFRISINEKKHVDTVGTLSSIVNYCTSLFDQEGIYESRANLLFPHYKSSPQSTQSIIRCEDNIGGAIEYFLNSFPCLNESVTCQSCANKRQKNIYSISLSCKQFHEEGIKNLEAYIESILRDKVVVCQKCNKKTAHANYNLFSYFLLDLEYLHERKNLPIFKLSVKKEICFKTNFEDIPPQIMIKNEKFEMIGIISFEGDSIEETPNTIVHYKTYIFSPNKEWILFDDMKENIQFLKETPCDKIALVMYIKSANR